MRHPYRSVVPALAALLAGCSDPFGTLSSRLRSPDLQAIEVFFRRVSASDASIDTLAAGEDVMVLVRSDCAGEFPRYRMVVTANADTVSDGQETCSCPDCRGGGSSGVGGRSWTPPGPGVYRFTAVLDADDLFAETDETNNTATGTLVVLGRGFSP